jgi:hypothetical protein
MRDETVLIGGTPAGLARRFVLEEPSSLDMSEAIRAEWRAGSPAALIGPYCRPALPPSVVRRRPYSATRSIRHRWFCNFELSTAKLTVES